MPALMLRIYSYLGLGLFCFPISFDAINEIHFLVMVRLNECYYVEDLNDCVADYLKK